MNIRREVLKLLTTCGGQGVGLFAYLLHRQLGHNFFTPNRIYTANSVRSVCECMGGYLPMLIHVYPPVFLIAVVAVPPLTLALMQSAALIVVAGLGGLIHFSVLHDWRSRCATHSDIAEQRRSSMPDPTGPLRWQNVTAG